ncbi:MAG TPA: transcription termination factor Rho [Acidimicrobiales bacterium]|nr:transcription termination factor Rho [Acidimicrobiales bacterium]
MSVESTTLERSALEGKDRDELTTIAQALGGQIRPRARKAEIVQLILELTGVESRAAAPDGGTPVPQDTAPDSPAEATPTEASTTADSAETSSPAPPEAAAPAEPDAADAETPDAGDEKANGKTEVEADNPAPADANLFSDAGASDSDSDTANEVDAGTASEAKPTERKPEGRNGGRAERNGQGQKAESQKPQGAQPQPQSQSQPQGRGQGQSQGGDQGGDQGDGDQGNRRRRRRGRSRGETGSGGGSGSPQVEEYSGEPVEVEGLLDLRDDGYGFLRVKGSLPSKDDIYVSVKQARQFGLRKGDQLKGASRPALRNEKNPALLRIDQVNGVDPEQAKKRPKFEDLTPLFPDEKLSLELSDDPGNMTARIIDLISPIGKGQRGLIVSPPKAGKTHIVKQIVRSIEVNNPEVKLMVLLVDERPEEVTDMRRWLRNPTSEAVASTFDRPADEHTQIAELTIERAKRLVEDGKDVVIVLDGITRLARAYNLAAPATGRIMSGGVDSGALYPPKKFFGAARNVEEGGSLTILATALVETGSKMDEVIFEEFKGTGNMELRLDRRLAERRVFPAIDVDASSTRHEELLFQRNQLQLVWALRRVLSGLASSDGGNSAALELLKDRMNTFRTNDEFLAEVAKNRLAAG